MDCVRRRGKIYNVVVAVPTDLVDVVGRRQIWRSLKTKTYAVARSEARKVLLSIEQYFQKTRGDMDSRLINGMVADYGLRWVRDTDKARLGIKVSDNVEYNDFMLHRAECQRSKEGSTDLVAKGMEELARIYQRDEGQGQHLNTPYATELADSYLTLFNKRGLIGEPEALAEGDFIEVTAAFATNLRQLYRVESERLQGITELDSDFQHRLLEKWNKDKLVEKDVGIPLPDLLMEYGAQWVNENAYIVKRKIKELGRLEESFRECFSKILSVKEVDEDKAVEWRNYLQHEYYSDRDLPLANKSVDNYIKTMSAVYNWARGRKDRKGKKAENCSKKPLKRYVEENPFSEGLQLKNYGKPNEQSRIFSDEELQKYDDVLAENFNPDEPEMVWLPQIMKYSGMRCNEVAQLFLDDVQEREGIQFFRIAPNKERKQCVKTNAEREVPIHHRLKELGFLKYVQGLRDAGEAKVFPNCRLQKTGYYYSDAMSTRLNAQSILTGQQIRY